MTSLNFGSFMQLISFFLPPKHFMKTFPKTFFLLSHFSLCKPISNTKEGDGNTHFFYPKLMNNILTK